jgi:endonuclease G
VCLIGLLVVLSGCVLAPPVESPPSIPSPIPSPSPSPPTSRSVHLLLGNPSNAVADVAKPDNYLMVKPQYALSYNRSKGTPNWVSWQLSSKWLGEAERQNNFRPDPQLPTGWYRVTPRVPLAWVSLQARQLPTGWYRVTPRDYTNSRPLA